MPDGPVTLGRPDRSGDRGGALSGGLGGDHRCVGNGSLGAGVDHPGHEECSRCAGCQGAEGEQALPRPPGDPAVKGIDPGGERRRQMVLYHHALCRDAAPVDRHQAIYQVLTGDCPAGGGFGQTKLCASLDRDQAGGGVAVGVWVRGGAGHHSGVYKGALGRGRQAAAQQQGSSLTGWKRSQGIGPSPRGPGAPVVQGNFHAGQTAGSLVGEKNILGGGRAQVGDGERIGQQAARGSSVGIGHLGDGQVRSGLKGVLPLGGVVGEIRVRGGTGRHSGIEKGKGSGGVDGPP